jgi:exopolyphosphatase/guanosine-5'-triphosphate,3'-diphosphate pyrophosphatase
MLLAGVDIGTLTCRLLIAEATGDGRLQEHQSQRRILRLGEGVDRTGLLSEAAMARVVATLREWRSLVDAAHVKGETAVATSAVRVARNRGEFVARVKEEAGFAVEVISGLEEARRTLLGIRAGLPHKVQGFLALDIGGGSTEFILCRSEHPPVARSIELGVVRLTERALRSDPPASGEIARAHALIRSSTEAIRPVLGALDDTTFLGTAGSITTLAAMAQELPAYQPARIHNYRLTLAAVRRLEATILGRTTAQRRGMPGLEEGREEVIAAGALILRTVMETLGFTECLVSDYGLREGILVDLAQRLGHASRYLPCEYHRKPFAS